MNTDKAHEFAINFEELSKVFKTTDKEIVLKDKDLYHRLFTVLRFKLSQELILFDREINCHVKILDFKKNGEIRLKVLNFKNNTKLTPTITWLLPVLKRQALEEAVYSLCETGVNSICLVITQKSQQSCDPKLLSRLNSIVISAAQQSKNFNYPEILPAINLNQIDSLINSEDKNIYKLYFDPNGDNLNKIVVDIDKIKNSHKIDQIFAMCGPEGDLISSEKELLKSLDFKFCRLTPTVLRSSQAVAVGSAILRSI